MNKFVLLTSCVKPRKKIRQINPNFLVQKWFICALLDTFQAPQDCDVRLNFLVVCFKALKPEPPVNFTFAELGNKRF